MIKPVEHFDPPHPLEPAFIGDWEPLIAMFLLPESHPYHCVNHNMIWNASTDWLCPFAYRDNILHWSNARVAGQYK
jgi:hypothetical protein